MPSTPQVMPSTRWTAPQSTPSAAWCLRIASSSGPSSRQYTWPSELWYSSTCRTPNWSARSLRVSSAICAMASDGSLRSAWKSMKRGMSVLLLSDRLQDRVSQRTDRPAAGRAAPLDQHRRNRREERGHDRDQGDLPARHAAYDHGADHGDRSGGPVRAGPSAAAARHRDHRRRRQGAAREAHRDDRQARQYGSELAQALDGAHVNGSPSPGRDRGSQPGPPAFLTLRRY